MYLNIGLGVKFQLHQLLMKVSMQSCSSLKLYNINCTDMTLESLNLLNHQPQWQIPYSGSLCNSTKPLKNWLVKSLWTIARINIQPEYTIGVRHVLTNFTTGKITGNLRMSLSVTQLAHYFWIKILNHTVASYVESN